MKSDVSLASGDREESETSGVFGGVVGQLLYGKVSCM